MKPLQCVKPEGIFHSLLCSVTEKKVPEQALTAEFLLSIFHFVTGDLTSGAAQACYLTVTVCFLIIPFLIIVFFEKSFTTEQVRTADLRIFCTVYKYRALMNWATWAWKGSFVLWSVANGVLSSVFSAWWQSVSRVENWSSTYTILPIGTGLLSAELLNSKVWFLQTVPSYQIFSVLFLTSLKWQWCPSILNADCPKFGIVCE